MFVTATGMNGAMMHNDAWDKAPAGLKLLGIGDCMQLDLHISYVFIGG
jgi:hypothetical protein